MTGPLGDPVDAEWAMLRGGVAVVEMARASGLALVAGRNDPLRASSRGTGELIAAAARSGARRIIVGVGGSASTDGGLGAVDALGWSLPAVDVTVACDVDDAVPRRGAACTARRRVHRPRRSRCSAGGLQRLAEQYESRTGVDVRAVDGGGAAGGLAGGLAALGATLEPGFDVVAGAAGLGDALEGASLVVTGEGRLDAHEPRRQGRRRRARVGVGARRRTSRRDRGSGRRRRARRRSRRGACWSSPSPTASGRRPRPSPAPPLLVEEAADSRSPPRDTS